MPDVLAKDRVLCASKVGSGHSNRIEDEGVTGDGGTSSVGRICRISKAPLHM